MPYTTIAELPLAPLTVLRSRPALRELAIAMTDAPAEFALVLDNQDAVLSLHSQADVIAQIAYPDDDPQRGTGSAPLVLAADLRLGEAEAAMHAASATHALIGAAATGWRGVLSATTLHNAAAHRHRVNDNHLSHTGASLRTLLDAIPDLIWLKDADGVYMACNRQFERLYDAREADIVGKDDYSFVPRELADLFRANDRAAAAAGGPRHNEEWLTYRDTGERALVDTTKTPIFDDDGKLVGVLGIGHDITHLRETETTLRRDTSYQRALLDNFPFLVWLKDTESRFLAVNLPLAEAVGCGDPAELIGKTDFDFSPPELAEAYVNDDREVMQLREKRMVEEEIELEGRRLWHQTYKAPVLDADGEMLGTVGFAMDVTERKETEQQRNQQLQELRSWQRATLGRESRVLELKREINELLHQRGEAPRYPSTIDDSVSDADPAPFEPG